MKNFSQYTNIYESDNTSKDIKKDVKNDDIIIKQADVHKKKIEAKRKDVSREDAMKNKVDVQTTITEHSKFIGKLLDFPKNTKTEDAYSFLKEYNISKEKLWYFLIEKNNELHIVKYNENKGFKVNAFIVELFKTYSNNNDIKKLINDIKIKGNDNFSIITNLNENNIKFIKNDLLRFLSK